MAFSLKVSVETLPYDNNMFSSNLAFDAEAMINISICLFCAASCGFTILTPSNNPVFVESMKHITFMSGRFFEIFSKRYFAIIDVEKIATLLLFLISFKKLSIYNSLLARVGAILSKKYLQIKFYMQISIYALNINYYTSL